MALNADNKYFMASVKILQAKRDLEKALEALDQGVPLSTMAMLRCSSMLMIETMENILLNRLTDHTNCPRRGCIKHCGAEAMFCGNTGCNEK